MKKEKYTDDELKAAQSDPDIQMHLQKVKELQSELTEARKQEHSLTARVMLRSTGAIFTGEYYVTGEYYLINKKDLFAWFENGDHLKKYSELDTL